MGFLRSTIIAGLFALGGVSHASLDSDTAPKEMPPVGNDLIVGTWAWTRSSNDCTEVYRYYRDGTVAVISGKEVTLGEYEIASQPNDAGRYKLTDTILIDHGGMDCADVDVDNTGESATIYVLFHDSGNAHWSMYEPTGDIGFGPLYRISK